MGRAIRCCCRQYILGVLTGEDEESCSPMLTHTVFIGPDEFEEHTEIECCRREA